MRRISLEVATLGNWKARHFDQLQGRIQPLGLGGAKAARAPNMVTVRARESFRGIDRSRLGPSMPMGSGRLNEWWICRHFEPVRSEYARNFATCGKES